MAQTHDDTKSWWHMTNDANTERHMTDDTKTFWHMRDGSNTWWHDTKTFWHMTDGSNTWWHMTQTHDDTWQKAQTHDDTWHKNMMTHDTKTWHMTVIGYQWLTLTGPPLPGTTTQYGEGPLGGLLCDGGSIADKSVVELFPLLKNLVNLDLTPTSVPLDGRVGIPFCVYKKYLTDCRHVSEWYSQHSSDAFVAFYKSVNLLNGNTPS